jgi:hypothetical protein
MTCLVCLLVEAHAPPVHHQEACTFWCHDCVARGCVRCMVHGHNGHRYVDLTEARPEEVGCVAQWWRCAYLDYNGEW